MCSLSPTAHIYVLRLGAALCYVSQQDVGTHFARKPKPPYTSQENWAAKGTGMCRKTAEEKQILELSTLAGPDAGKSRPHSVTATPPGSPRSKPVRLLERRRPAH
ncbi:hypothetical protein EVG20_g6227 [Dentipellis fragilis]|uniref:Uncharacterized protein n=1 Tax=Dentipellis fragilis TaxID=205917 RepID=A0A4Y9YMM7_9AGAM|nr:hypothetical protein EVG20_g6227 [Dentipellis fragilis]